MLRGRTSWCTFFISLYLSFSHYWKDFEVGDIQQVALVHLFSELSIGTPVCVPASPLYNRCDSNSRLFDSAANCCA